MAGEPIAVYTVLYPGALPFVCDWYASVEAQTDPDFDLWISLDGVSIAQATALLRPTRRIAWLSHAAGITPAELRDDALALLVGRYPHLICTDSDDVLVADRVAAARAGLGRHDLVACALYLADDRGGDLGAVFGPPPELDPVGVLADWNVFGLSNSAWRSAALRACLPLGADCAIPDWLLATRAWLDGADLWFDREPHMWYRQHAGNVARTLPPFTAADVRRATALVLAHHAKLVATPRRGSAAAQASLARARRRVHAFHDWIERVPDAGERYVACLNQLAPCHVWWWAVANPHLEALWTS